MNEQTSPALREVLAACARYLQSACIQTTGIIQVPVVKADRIQWVGPCLRPNLSLGETNLNDLPRYLYGEGQLSRTETLTIWNDAVAGLLRERNARPVIEGRFPEVKFTRGRIPPTMPLLQLLCVLSWSGGTFKVTRKEAFLDLGSTRIGMNHRMIMWNGDLVRLPRQCTPNPPLALSIHMGKPQSGHESTTAVYRYLTRILPQLSPQLDLIFATAVTAGKEFEALLCHLFDLVPVESVESVEYPAGVWARARRTVMEATITPVPDLWAIFKNTSTRYAFEKLFGNASRKGRPTYSSALRKKHLSIIDQAESGDVNLTITRRTGDQVAAATKLLQLQRMIGQCK